MFDLKNKKITVMGLGSRGGVEVVKFLGKRGARLTVTDLKEAADLPLEDPTGLDINFILGGHREQDFTDADLVLHNPAVPAHNHYLEVARRHKVPVWMESTLFFTFCPSQKIIGVTGTKGKTTTATLIYEILKKSGKEAVLAGNMGISMVGKLPRISKDTYVVLELSSFQLEGLAPIKKSPWIAIITNIYPDHLNYYRDFEDYIAAKKEIGRYQGRGDILLIDKENPCREELLRGVKSKSYFVETDPARIAQRIGQILDLSPGAVDEAIKGFPGLPHRLERIAVKSGVTFYNDSCATNPHATVYSIERLGVPTVLITGGTDKNLDYKILAEKINKEGIKTALLEGSATKKLVPLLKRRLIIGSFSDLASAVERALESSEGKKAVLFSPASASFEMFSDEFDRGEKFREAVNSVRFPVPT